MNPNKSAHQSAPGLPFVKGADTRRGKGPKPGAANAGRYPDEIRAACRLAFDERVPLLASFADDSAAEPMVRMKALEMLAKYGLGAPLRSEHANNGDEKIMIALKPCLHPEC